MTDYPTNPVNPKTEWEETYLQDLGGTAAESEEATEWVTRPKNFKITNRKPRESQWANWRRAPDPGRDPLTLTAGEFKGQSLKGPGKTGPKKHSELTRPGSQARQIPVEEELPGTKSKGSKSGT